MVESYLSARACGVATRKPAQEVDSTGWPNRLLADWWTGEIIVGKKRIRGVGRKALCKECSTLIEERRC